MIYKACETYPGKRKGGKAGKGAIFIKRQYKKKKMSKRMGGFRRKTRDKLKKAPRTKGKISIRHYLREFKSGDSVNLSAEPAVQKGMYLPRYHGRTAKVIGKQGACYKVSIQDGGLQKTLIVHPVHLQGVREHGRD